MAEHLPTLAPYLEQEGLSLEHPSLRRLVPPYGGTERSWHDQTPAERAATRTPRGPWWSAPAGRTIDLATALFPELLYERLDEHRHRLRGGLSEPRAWSSCTPTTSSTGAGTCRALNRANAETFAPLADRLTPVAAIPMHTPEEAVAELEYAVTVLGFKAVLCAGYVQRPFDALAGQDPEVSRYAFWLDQFGMDSAYDYDPVWARAQELGVSIAFHSGFIGMTPYRSPSSYVFNHLSMLAEGQQSLAKSLFLGGVTRRFPRMNFAFLEGGVAWAAALYSDIVGHWEKRNLAGAPGPPRPRPHRPRSDGRDDGSLRPGRPRLPARPDPPSARGPRTCSTSGPRAASSEAGDIKAPVRRPLLLRLRGRRPAHLAWPSTPRSTRSAPSSQAMMGSDIAHWDVPDMTEVLEEAWEMVEHGWIDEAAFEKFTFTNPVRFYTGTNPAFFKGTVVESAVDRLLGRGLTCSTCCSPAGRWSTAPATRRVAADVGIRDGRIAVVGSTTEPARSGGRRDRPGGLPGLHRPAHPLRRPAALGPHGQPLGPPRGDHGAGRQLRVLRGAPRARRRRLHPADDGGGRGHPARGPGGRRALGLAHLRRVPRPGRRRPGRQRRVPGRATRPCAGW